MKAIATDLRKQKFAGVERVKDGQQTSKRILQVARVIEAVFLVAVVVLLIASTLLIANTIRLSIFSRRREIEVMKLVGATNWFVRGPFMLEGLLCGFAGALGAVLLLLLGRELAVNRITDRVDVTSDVQALALPMIALILIGVGLAVGALGSGYHHAPLPEGLSGPDRGRSGRRSRPPRPLVPLRARGLRVWPRGPIPSARAQARLSRSDRRRRPMRRVAGTVP